MILFDKNQMNCKSKSFLKKYKKKTYQLQLQFAVFYM